MNIIFLSPCIPHNTHHYCRHLFQQGSNVLAIGQAAYESLTPALSSVLTEYYKVDDIHNYDQLLRAVAYFTHRYGKIDAIEGLSPFWLSTEARLRTDFNVTCNPLLPQSWSAIRKLFRKGRVTTPAGEAVSSLEAAQSTADTIGYPIAIYPDTLNSHDECAIIQNADELTGYFSTQAQQAFFMEKALPLQTRYALTGLLAADGSIVFNQAYILDTENGQPYCYSQLEVPADLAKAGQNVLKASQIHSRFFHIEFHRTEKNKLVGHTIRFSPMHPAIVDMMNFANDIDIYQVWGQILLGNSVAVQAETKYATACLTRTPNAAYAHSHEEILANYQELIVAETQSPLSPLHQGVDHMYIARSTDITEILALINFIYR